MHNIAESEREKGNPERLSAYLCGGVNPEPVNAYQLCCTFKRGKQ